MYFVYKLFIVCCICLSLVFCLHSHTTSLNKKITDVCTSKQEVVGLNPPESPAEFFHRHLESTEHTVLHTNVGVNGKIKPKKKITRMEHHMF